MNFRFQKKEKLKSRKTIEFLFEKGKSKSVFPLKMFYSPNLNSENTQATFAVPKRNFKRAVDRNRIKRQLRGSYRLQKHLLNTDDFQPVAILFLYLGKEEVPSKVIESAMISLLKKLNL